MALLRDIKTTALTATSRIAIRFMMRTPVKWIEILGAHRSRITRKQLRLALP
jgi:hypothetical protein